MATQKRQKIEGNSPNMDHLSAHPLNVPSQSSMPFSCPTVIGEFCLNQTREINLGRADIRYLCETFVTSDSQQPNIKLDLTTGFSTVIEKKGNEGIKMLLRWIQLMGPPKSSLKKLNTEAKIKRETTMDKQAKMMCYWGHKFEQCITSVLPGGSPETSAPVNTCNEFCAMFKAAIGVKEENFRIIYGAEIDCISPTKGDYLEIKTQYNKIGHGFFFDNKAMKWWLQSYLANVKTLVVGLRDNEGIINKVELQPVDQLPKNWSKSWEYNKCLTFIHVFLKRIKHILDNLPEGEVILAERRPKSYEFVYQFVDRNDPEYDILDNDFRQHFS
ncbi:RAI1 like PD-(D/E)XK nuclease domain-containing protein [Ditylenchus destructor]|nr:RAI1 like PD-(D/E)XK nuclease domain-containing protein [Ditylenchus destructor]